MLNLIVQTIRWESMITSLFDNPLFNICFLVGVIFIAAGILMLQFPPKKINSLYGYRTKSSMKDQDRWRFAQKFSAKEMVKLGVFLILASVTALVTNFNDSINLIIGTSLVMIGLAVLFIKVERAIKTKFIN